MRMWNIKPNEMCNKHLLGEHVEMHMFVGTINKNKSIQGYLDNQLVEVHNISKRHKELVKEMNRRGFNHKTPINFRRRTELGFVDSKLNKKELHRRCKDCRKLSK